jgi:hypothetical protein
MAVAVAAAARYADNAIQSTEFIGCERKLSKNDGKRNLSW